MVKKLIVSRNFVVRLLVVFLAASVMIHVPAQRVEAIAPGALGVGSAAGVWQSEEVGILRISQFGSNISGSYDKGVFAGSIEGHTISFKLWEEATSYESADPEDRGSGTLILSEDWNSLIGSYASDEGDYGGNFSAVRIEGVLDWTGEFDLEDLFDHENSHENSTTPYPTPFSSYVEYGVFDDVWYDANGNIIEDAYTFEIYLQDLGYEYSPQVGWTNYGIPITNLGALQDAYFEEIGCTICQTDFDYYATPGGGTVYSSYVQNYLFAFDSILYNPLVGGWVFNEGDSEYYPTNPPFRQDFHKWMADLGYEVIGPGFPLDDRYSYFDAEGKSPDLEVMFNIYCITNGSKQGSDPHTWISPNGTTITNPFAEEDPQIYEQEEYLPIEVTDEQLLETAQLAQQALNALNPVDPTAQEAFDILVDENGFEY